MSSPSLVIRNGTIVDGSGGDPYEADLAVTEGEVSSIGGNTLVVYRHGEATGALPGCPIRSVR